MSMHNGFAEKVCVHLPCRGLLFASADLCKFGCDQVTQTDPLASSNMTGPTFL